MNDSMPYSVATALLLSGYTKTNRFRKVCQKARERVIEPVSCSTQLSVIAPKTYGQRLVLKLRKMNARQLHQWAKRTLRQGNRLQDALAQTEDRMPLESERDAHEAELAFFNNQIEMLDTLGQAIKTELDRRASVGKGYQKPTKFSA